MATQSNQSNQSNSTATVTVACKHPSGLHLQLHHFFDHEVPVPGGGTKTEKLARPVGEPVRVAGPATPHGEAPKAIIVGGYALTPGVPKEFWDKWCEQNKGAAVLKNHVLFAYEKEADTRADAKEHAKLRTGMEPIDPKAPPQIGRAKIKVDDAVKSQAALEQEAA
jgi:hypothetical protein